MTEYRVGTIMQRDIPTLTPHTPIRRAIAVLVGTRAQAVPVLGDTEALVGILTGKDCFRPALHASYHRGWSGQVADHMSARVVTVDIDDELIGVAEMFLDHPHRAFPVLSDGRCVGLLHRSDVLAWLSRLS